jgi:ABC-type uncharacterized transport system auxiliary subunit
MWTSSASAPFRYAVVIGIEPFDAEPSYQQDRIIFRTSPYEVNFYEYHRWLVLPNELVTDQVYRLFAASDLFQHVHTYGFEAYADYILQGKIAMFDQWYHGDETSSTIRIGIYYRFITTEDEQVLWMDSIETTTDVHSVEMVETVKGFESALHANIQDALEAIDTVLAPQQE